MKVTAIMPTRGRREFARAAIDCFLAQTYPEKELVILDDEREPSFPRGLLDVPAGPIRYYRDPSRSIPVKRNRCCELAGGEIIAHFDSDDWYAPGRLAKQVALLESSGKSVVGYSSIMFFRESDGAVFLYHQSNYGLGSSLVYRKSWWQDNLFDARKLTGEDEVFQRAAQRAKQFACLPGVDMLVARIHAGNTAKKSPERTPGYSRSSEAALPAAFIQSIQVAQ